MLTTQRQTGHVKSVHLNEAERQAIETTWIYIILTSYMPKRPSR